MKNDKALMYHPTRCMSPVWSTMLCGVITLAVLLAGLPHRSTAAESASHAQKHTPQEYRYHYVSLDAAIPAGFDFLDIPFKLTDSGLVYVNAYACAASCSISIAVYRRGTMTILQEGIGYTANERGTVGGSVLLDPENFIEQAALFTRHGVERIPPRPGEFTSHVLRLTDSGLALVESVDATTFQSTFYLYKRGHVTSLNLGPNQVDFLDVNDEGRIAGTFFVPGPNNDRAFRFDPFSGRMTLLNPLPTEPDSWGQGINRRGDVLGYSFVAGGLERIGVWRHGKFQTYFVEGTPQFPTISNRLLWNDKGLIVITRTSRADLNSYLVPRPGVRLKLADLTDRLPVWTLITDVNNHGDLIGVGGSAYFNGGDTFLLQRLDTAED